MKSFKPMLAATIEEPNELRFPLLVSPKLDGLRCYISSVGAHSRSGKLFRNAFVQETLRGLPEGLDGELIVGPPTGGHVLNRTQSGIMAIDTKPEFTYWVFDNFAIKDTFWHRWSSLEEYPIVPLRIVPHLWVDSLKALLEVERVHLEAGYEGIMTRSLDGAYKYGRSTLAEGGLGKLKRFRDGEAQVLALEEGVTNLNPTKQNALGYTERSSHQANMLKSGKVGTIIGKDLQTQEILQISPGRMTHDEREYFWENPQALIDKVVKYKTFDYGALNVPRFSTFQAFRSAEDM